MKKCHPVYIINLKKRDERRKEVLDEFIGKPEFDPIIIEAIEDKNGALGLWITIKTIIKEIALSSPNDFIIICEDDHKFTKNYNKDILFTAIQEAKSLDAEILSGGVSFLSTGLSVSNNLIWMEIFSGLQFTIIFKSFYQKILDSEFTKEGSADTVFSVIGDRKFCIFPYISVQSEYGYSDVTPKNNGNGRVKTLFERSFSKARSISYLTNYWLDMISSQPIQKVDKMNIDSLQLSCFIIDFELPGSHNKIDEIEFLNKNEFSSRIITCPIGSQFNEEVSKTIKSIVEKAISEQMDAVGITFSFHEFTPFYKKEYFFENFYDAYHQDCEILAGGTSNFDIAIPVSLNRFWMNRLIRPSFLVIYKAAFNKILETDCEDHEPYYIWLSRISTNKMCIYPFISNADIKISDYFQMDMESSYGEEYNRTINRLKTIQEKFNKYCLNLFNPIHRG